MAEVKLEALNRGDLFVLAGNKVKAVFRYNTSAFGIGVVLESRKNYSTVLFSIFYTSDFNKINIIKTKTSNQLQISSIDKPAYTRDIIENIFKAPISKI